MFRFGVRRFAEAEDHNRGDLRDALLQALREIAVGDLVELLLKLFVFQSVLHHVIAERLLTSIKIQGENHFDNAVKMVIFSLGSPQGRNLVSEYRGMGIWQKGGL